MMADPAFVQKLLMESVICTGSSLLWEVQQRGERFGAELDLVAINTLSLLAANVALVWCAISTSALCMDIVQQSDRATMQWLAVTLQHATTFWSSAGVS